MRPENISPFFQSLLQDNPHPKSELYFTNHFTLLIAVILSAQATDRGVNKVTCVLFDRLRTPEDFLEFGEAKLLEAIRTIGLYKTKASNIMKTCALLIQKYGSQVPENREELESLPGVGRKTANVVLNAAFGFSTIAVDTHVFRVSHRTGLSTGKTPVDVERDLEKLIPKEFKKDAHHWLILLGRHICKARLPECWRCPVSHLCEFENKSAKPL